MIANVIGFSIETPNEGPIKFIISHISEVIGVRLPKVSIVQIPTRDWVFDNLKAFTPITIGQYFVRGALSNERTPHGKIGLSIRALSSDDFETDWQSYAGSDSPEVTLGDHFKQQTSSEE